MAVLLSLSLSAVTSLKLTTSKSPSTETCKCNYTIPQSIIPSFFVLIPLSHSLLYSLISLSPLPPSTPLSLCLCGWVWGISVLLTSLSPDLQRIRSPSYLPLFTAIAPILRVPMPIIDAGDVDSQIYQKATLPKEMKRNMEVIGPCMSNSLQLGIGLFAILAVCYLNHF